MNAENAHILFSKLPILQDSSLQSFLPTFDNNGTTPFTRIKGGKPTWRSDRPALLVSSTSWTADEDFSILLEALNQYEQAANNAKSGTLPKVLVVITGKGALRSAFEKEAGQAETKWDYVKCRTAWMAISEYPKLLGKETSS